jgi:hypothetical protein
VGVVGCCGAVCCTPSTAASVAPPLTDTSASCSTITDSVTTVDSVISGVGVLSCDMAVVVSGSGVVEGDFFGLETGGGGAGLRVWSLGGLAGAA